VYRDAWDFLCKGMEEVYEEYSDFAIGKGGVYRKFRFRNRKRRCVKKIQISD
jgi:hypothetical protein